MGGAKLLLSPLSPFSVHFSAKDRLAGHERDDERGSAAVVAAKVLLTRIDRHAIKVRLRLREFTPSLRV